MKKRIRKSVLIMIEDGIDPMSIVAAHGQMMTPDEYSLLMDYEKEYKEKHK